MELLVVDDNRLVVDAIGRFARRRGFQPSQYTSAIDAEGHIDRLHSPPVGAVIDVWLDNRRMGYQLGERLRGRFNREVALVMMTGYPHDERVSTAIAACEPELVLEKPLSFEALERVLRRAVVRRVFLGVAATSRKDVPETIDSDAPGGQSDLQSACASLAARFDLSPQETRILALLSTGAQRRELPEMSGISANTIKSQVRSLLSKMGVKTTGEVVSILLREMASQNLRRASACSVIG